MTTLTARRGGDRGQRIGKGTVQRLTSLFLWVQEHSRFLYGLLGVVIVLGSWQVLAATGVIDVTFTSSPSRVVAAEIQLFGSGQILTPILTTATEAGEGLLASVIIGIPLGLIIGRVRALDQMTEPIISVLNSAPYVLFLPVLIPWTGIGERTRVLMVIWAASLPLVVSTTSGAKNVDRDYLRVAKVFCAGRFLFYRSVLLQASLPYILTGLRLAVARGLVAAIVAEFLLGSGGLGYFVETSSSSLEMNRAMAGIVMMAAAAVLLVKLIAFVERRYAHWSQA